MTLERTGQDNKQGYYKESGPDKIGGFGIRGLLKLLYIGT